MRRVRSALAALPPGAVVGALAAAAILAPVLGRGYVLTYDMVFVPEPPLTRGMLGLDPGVARAVPSDLVVAVLSRLVPTDVVQKLLLVGTFVAAGWGSGRLVGSGRAAASAAAAFYCWNAFVYERLVIGHWALLIGYAALPWVVLAARRVAAGEAGGWPRTVVAVGVAALGSPTGGLLAAVVAVAVVGWPRAVGARTAAVRAGLAAAAGLAVNLPWLLPSVLRPGGVPADADGVAAFAARADTPLGTIGSLLTLGGVWNAEVAPPGRTALPVVAVTAALIAVAVLGVKRYFAMSAEAVPLAAVSLLLLVVAAAGAVPGLRGIARQVVVAVPGGGIIRDGQKFVMPLALVLAVGFGLAVETLRLRVRDAEARPLLAAVAVLAPVAVLPALGWGAAGRLRTAHYPAEWYDVRSVLDRAPEAGGLVVLPWNALYQPFDWNSGRPVLDPAQRWFDRSTLVDDDLTVDDRVVAGEDPRADAVDAAVAAGAPLEPVLAAVGVRFAVVHQWRQAPAGQQLTAADRVYDGAQLDLYRLRQPAGESPDGPPVGPVVVGDAVAGALLLWGIAAIAGGGRRQPANLAERRSERSEGEL
ncbi:MAG TPA: hypothetical protein VEZ46_03140 [Mycobacteriales bacterium]|nr:hypothetical protein [Mycobacteriales bacterium]